MSEFWQKLLWVAVPAFTAAAITMVPVELVELRVIAYGMLALVSAAGIWITGAKKRREEDEARKAEEKEADVAWRVTTTAALRLIIMDKVEYLTQCAVDAGCVTMKQRNFILSMVDVAHALGANGEMTACAEIVKEMPIKKGGD